MQSETFINSQVIQQEVFSSVCQEVAEDCVACVENRLNDLENAKANSLGYGSKNRSIDGNKTKEEATILIDKNEYESNENLENSSDRRQGRRQSIIMRLRKLSQRIIPNREPPVKKSASARWRMVKHVVSASSELKYQGQFNKTVFGRNKVSIKPLAHRTKSMAVLTAASQESSKTKRLMAIIHSAILYAAGPFHTDDKTLMHVWHALSIFLTLIFLIFLPLDIAFSDSANNGILGNQTSALFSLAIVVTLVDSYICMNTSFVDDGNLVVNRKLLWKRYIFTGELVVDLVALFGLIYHPSILGPNYKPFGGGWNNHFPDLLRTFPLIKAIFPRRKRGKERIWEDIEMRFGIYARVFQLVMSVTILAHILGCMWSWIANIEVGIYERTWFSTALDSSSIYIDESQISYHKKYISALYFSFITLTTVGYGDIHPVTDAERVVAMICTCLGSVTFATMVGRMTSLANTMEGNRSAFRNRIDSINEYMRHRNLPPQLRRRIREYMLISYSNGVYFSEEQVLKDLSYDLRKEVMVCLKRDFIKKVPFFRDAEPEFITELVLKLRQRTIVPQETIIRCGDIGREMFLLDKGEVEILDSDEKVATRLFPGSFFGEISLLYPNIRRTSTVRSVTTCELLVLNRNDFTDVLDKFPAFHQTMEIIAQARLTRLGELVPLKTQDYSAGMGITDNTKLKKIQEEIQKKGHSPKLARLVVSEKNSTKTYNGNLNSNLPEEAIQSLHTSRSANTLASSNSTRGKRKSISAAFYRSSHNLLEKQVAKSLAPSQPELFGIKASTQSEQISCDAEEIRPKRTSVTYFGTIVEAESKLPISQTQPQESHHSTASTTDEDPKNEAPDEVRGILLSLQQVQKESLEEWRATQRQLVTLQEQILEIKRSIASHSLGDNTG